MIEALITRYFKALPPDRLRRAWAAAVGDILPFAAVFLGMMYLVLSLSHRIFLPPEQASILGLLAALSAVLLWGLVALLFRKALPVRLVHPLSAFVALIVLLNSAAHQFITGDIKHSTNFMLLIVGLGFLLISPDWYLIMLSATLGTWGVLVHGQFVVGDMIHYAYALGMATLVSLIVFLGRLRLIIRLEVMRMQDEQRQEALEASLQATRASESKLSGLIEATRSLAQPTGSEHLLSKALEHLVLLVPYDSAVVLLGGTDTLTVVARYGGVAELAEHAPSRIYLGENPVLRDVFRAGQPVIVELQPQPAYWLTLISDPECRSWVLAPLFSRGAAMGLLILGSHKVMRYDAEDLRLLTAFADHLASALHNALLIEWTQKALERLAFLYEATRILNTVLETDQILETLMRLAYEQIQPEAISIALAQPDGSMLFKAASGGAGDKIVGVRVPKGKGLVGWVAQQGEPVWVPDVSNDPRFYGMVDKQTGFSTQSIYALPVRMGDEIVAVMEMINPRPDTDIAELRDSMISLAALAASALQNARLFEQVQKAEQRYQNLFDLNVAPLLVFDAQGRLLEANRAARELFGQELQPGDDAFSLLQLTPERFFQIVADLSSGKQPVWELLLQTPSGPCILESHITLLAGYGQQDAYQWLGHDVTERVELAEVRSRLNRMIVHDLRNPLGVMRASLDMAAECGPEDRALWEGALRLARRSLTRMNDLVENLLDTARMGAGHTDISFEAFSLDHLVADVEESVLSLFESRRQRFNIQIDPPNAEMVAHRDFLRRVLINLLDNASKFSPSGTDITLTIQKDLQARVWSFAVKDQGPGIPPEEQANIFQEFVRGHAQRGIRGTGLGLAFCKMAIEAHGGRIWLESEAGEGATFKFTIPLDLPAQGAHPAGNTG